MRRALMLTAVAAATAALAAQAVSAATGPPPGNQGALAARVVSSPANLVSGGDARVEVTVPAGVAFTAVRVTLNGADVSSSFGPDPEGGHQFEGVVTRASRRHEHPRGLGSGAGQRPTGPPHFGTAPGYNPAVHGPVEWTHWADLVNIYGTDESGFARSPWDNVGVQYGLGALNDGAITPEQFLDVNATIGSWKESKDMV